MSKSKKNLQAEERKYINSVLTHEFVDKFLEWNEEYGSQERDLGMSAEFVNMWRKAKKIKAIVWDRADATGWREDLRTILFEIIGHCFLMIFDLDKEHQRLNPPPPATQDVFLKDFRERAHKLAADQKTMAGKPAEDEPVRVPFCGHIRCIEHEKLPLEVLSPSGLARYEQELRDAQNGHVPASAKELGKHD